MKVLHFLILHHFQARKCKVQGHLEGLSAWTRFSICFFIQTVLRSLGLIQSLICS